MPTAVQIKGSPDFRFAAKFDIGDYLKEFFNKDDFKQQAEDIELLECENEKIEIVTYLVYMKLYEQEIPLGGLSTLAENTPGNSFISPRNITLTSGSLEVPSLDFGDYLKDFSFDNSSVKSKLYISGSPIIEGLSVKLTVADGVPVENRRNTASGLKGRKDTYDGIALPEGGADIDFPFSDDKFNVDYEIFVKAGETINKEWMNDPSVFVELAVWLPFKFKATKAGAEVKLPEDLFPEGDLFGRENSDGDNTITEMLESLDFAMKMNTNPFEGASFIVKSKGIEINNPIKGNSLEFALDEKKMEVINSPESYPFAPKLKLIFNNGGILSFPREFVITEISFKAKLNHTIDLSGGIN